MLLPSRDWCITHTFIAEGPVGEVSCHSFLSHSMLYRKFDCMPLFIVIYIALRFFGRFRVV